MSSPSPLIADEKPRTTASVFKVCWDYLRQLATLILFFLLNLTFGPLSALLAYVFRGRIPSSVGQRLIYHTAGFWLGFARRMGTIVVDYPKEDFRDLRGTIVAPNHPSLIDAMILLSLLPRTVCVMRADLAINPVLGGMAMLAGHIPNDSGHILIREGIEKIREGENILIFPEGTRTRNQPVNAFKKGFALIAAKVGAPIQTIFIEREGLYLSKQCPLFKAARLPVRYRVRVGEVLRAEEGERAQELSLRVEKYFRDHLVNTGEDIRLR